MMANSLLKFCPKTSKMQTTLTNSSRSNWYQILEMDLSLDKTLPNIDWIHTYTYSVLGNIFANIFFRVVYSQKRNIKTILLSLIDRDRNQLTSIIWSQKELPQSVSTENVLMTSWTDN